MTVPRATPTYYVIATDQW